MTTRLDEIEARAKRPARLLFVLAPQSDVDASLRAVAARLKP